MKRSLLLPALLWLGIASLGTWMAIQHRHMRSLRHSLENVASSTALPPTPKPPPAPGTFSSTTDLPGGHPSLPAVEQLARLGAPARALLASSQNRSHPGLFATLDSELDALTPDDWAALVRGDAALAFSSQYDQAAVPDDAWIDATIRWRAYQRLAVADPVAALKLTERADLTRASGSLINLITESLQRWTAADPVAALHWGKSRADSLPLGINHAHMALEAIARNDMAGAWAIARREGFDPAQAMSYLFRAAATTEACDEFMQQVEDLRTHAPHGFVAGANQYLPDFAARIAHSAGFEQARAFVEKWAGSLEWRDQAALAAVQSTFSRTPNPQSAEAATWMLHFTPAHRQAGAVENLISAWAVEDFSQPAAWLQQQASEPWHAAGLVALCRALAPFDPAAAEQWAAGISDPAMRAAALTRKSP
jgi:hypothetical protein